jgi:hypothetical protein
MANAKRTKSPQHSARRNNVRSPLPRSICAEYLTRSFGHALGTSRMSQAAAARSMGVSLSTVQKWVAGKVPVNALHVLRSQRLAHSFCLHLCQIVAVRNGRA